MRKLIIILLLISLSLVSYAAPFDDLHSEILAISLVIDTSGSMIETDPQGLRGSVADAFIDYLNPEDYLGIITFNNEVDFLIPMQQLKDDTTRNDMREGLSSRLYGYADTDYTSALKEANLQLQGLNNPDATKLIIFITDGQPDPPLNIMSGQSMENYMVGLWESVEDIRDNQYPVYSIAFSDAIDVDILNRIANETGGDVRIYKDAMDLDENLVQSLVSRETIVEELLETEDSTSEIGLNLEPHIASDFWLKSGGYRNGESTVISASIMVARSPIISGGDLIIDQFHMITEYEDGMSIKTSLFDDGAIGHSDIRANDGIWSNTLSFTRNGRAKAILVMTGTANGLPLVLEKDIGEFLVADPGNIYVKQYDDGIWARPGDTIKIGLNLKNDSEFKERILLSLDESIGSLPQHLIDLEPKSDQDYDLTILLNPNLDYRTYDLAISGKPMEATTNIHGNNIEFDIEVVSRFEGLKREILGSSSILLWSIGLLLGLPLLIYILGIILYGILVKSQLKVRGRLIYWDEFNLENKTEIDLSSYKKNRITITFKDWGQGDYRISDSNYNHDIEIYMDLVKKRRKFILGWMSLLSKKATTQILMETSQPGIIEYEGNIFTKMNLYDGSVFISGEYAFKYTKAKTILNKEIDEGKNILEGKI